MVACGMVFCGFDFNMEVDGLFVVAYGLVVSWLDLMWSYIDGFFVVAFWVVVCGVDFIVEVYGYLC